MLNLNNPTNRVLSIDRFRGFALALMIMFGAAKALSCAPIFLSMSTHDLSAAMIVLPNIGFYDIIAPMFVFACGLSLGVSAYPSSGSGKSRLKNTLSLLGLGSVFYLSFDPIGIIFFICSAVTLICVILWFIGCKTTRLDKKFISVLLRKFLPVIGGFALIVAIVENILLFSGKTVPSEHWSVLASIGVAALLCAACENLRTFDKLIMCITLSALYFAANIFIPQENFLYFTHGGLLGSLGWALIAFYGFTAADLRRYSSQSYMAFGGCIFIIGYILVDYILPLKNAVNLSYSMITSGICFICFGFFECLNSVKTKYAPLSVAGKNSLLLYIIHLIIHVPAGTVINALLELIPVGKILHTIIAAISLIGYFLLFSYLIDKANKKGFKLKL